MPKSIVTKKNEIKLKQYLRKQAKANDIKPNNFQNKRDKPRSQAA